MGARRASTLAVAAVAGAVLLLTLLVTWAASIGPDTVLAGDGPATHRASPVPSTATPSGSPSATPSPQRSAASTSPPRVLTALAAVIWVTVAVVIVAGLVLAGRRLWQAWVDRRRAPPPPPEVDFEVLEEPRRVVEEIARDAPRQRELLEEGTPRNGIVACWQRFEVQAGEAGVRRRSWETSAEFTLRVLDLADADAGPVNLLAGLFREARFSDHPLDESARSRALAALDAIHAGLAATRKVGR